MEKKGFWQVVWYWYYKNWQWIFKILFWVVMLVAFAILLSVPQDKYNIYVGFTIVGSAVIFVMAIGCIMSWLAERYLRNYDADYRWHLKYNRGERL